MFLSSLCCYLNWRYFVFGFYLDGVPLISIEECFSIEVFYRDPDYFTKRSAKLIFLLLINTQMIKRLIKSPLNYLSNWRYKWSITAHLTWPHLFPSVIFKNYSPIYQIHLIQAIPSLTSFLILLIFFPAHPLISFDFCS